VNCVRIICVSVLSWGLLVSTRADTVQDHQVTQARPIQLGTSGGNVNDISSLYCCSGTLGALVKDKKNRLYILSNNHVLGRVNRSRKREPITQPGLVDADCSLGLTDAVASFTKRKGIHFNGRSPNVVDAAIAEILPGQVDTNGNILGIGTLSSAILEPSVGLAVKKSGRTTGVTQGVIAAVDVAILVSYNKTCGVGEQLALFVHQIRITPGGFGDFSSGGDSGSLVMEDVDSCPRAVGLLFAGGDVDTFANPIANVLSQLKVKMAGCTFTSSVAAAALAEAPVARRVSAESFAACKSAKEMRQVDLLKTPGVVGVGIGISDSEPGQAVLEVYCNTETTALEAKLPKTLQSVPVKIIKTGTIRAF
jgi:hypothetical protein